MLTLSSRVQNGQGTGQTGEGSPGALQTRVFRLKVSLRRGAAVAYSPQRGLGVPRESADKAGTSYGQHLQEPVSSSDDHDACLAAKYKGLLSCTAILSPPCRLVPEIGRLSHCILADRETYGTGVMGDSPRCSANWSLWLPRRRHQGTRGFPSVEGPLNGP